MTPPRPGDVRGGNRAADLPAARARRGPQTKLAFDKVEGQRA